MTPSIHLAKLLACPSQHEENPVNNNGALCDYWSTTNVFRDVIPSKLYYYAALINCHSREAQMNYSNVEISMATLSILSRPNNLAHAVKASWKNKPIFYLHCDRLYIKLAKVRTYRSSLFFFSSTFYTRRVR